MSYSRRFNLSSVSSFLFSPLIFFSAFATLLLGFLDFTLLTPTSDNASAETATNVAGSTSNYYISVSSENVPLVAKTDGTVTTATSNVTATSNTGSGYKIYLSMDNSSTNGNRLYLDNSTSSDSYIAPTTSSSLDNNSWGISLDGTSYQAVPLLGQELLVKEYTSSTPSSTIPVTYGVKIDGVMPAEEYTGGVVYTALGNAPTSTLLSTTTAYTMGGGTLTISTPLLNSQDTLPTAVVTIGGTTCTNPTVSKNANTGIYEVSCTIPAKSAGSYDVVVNYTGLQAGTTASYTASSQLTYITPTIATVSPTSRYTPGTQAITMITNIPKDTPMTITSAQVGSTANNCTSPTITNSGDYRAITCTSPSLSAGTYAVSANVTINGSSSTTITKSNAITYIEPAISSVSPSTDLNTAGGQTLTIVLNLTSSTTISNASVTIGGTTCTSPTITTSGSNRAITCTTPAKSAGTYTVATTFTLNGATATPSLANAVTYKTPAPDITTISNMQDITSTLCKNTAEGISKALTDTRDNQSYTVFKAKDGNCWMGENLRYGATTGGAARAYTSTDAAKSNNINTTNMANLTTSRICTTKSNCKTPDNVNMFSPVSTDPYTFSMPYILIYQANTAATYDGKTKYGVLYNYCAVTGGTVCVSTAMSSDASGSICPKGWKLPGMTANATGTGAVTDGSVKTYNNLANSYGYGNTQVGMNGMFSSPTNFLRAGNANAGSLRSRSTSGYGFYWSSTKYTSTNRAYYMSFKDSSDSYVSQSSSLRYNGLSARCVSAS